MRGGHITKQDNEHNKQEDARVKVLGDNMGSNCYNSMGIWTKRTKRVHENRQVRVAEIERRSVNDLRIVFKQKDCIK